MNIKLLYIGNKLSKKGYSVTSVETLGMFLKQEGFKVKSASAYKNKTLRFLDMLYQTARYGKKVDYVLIDTYSTQNFWYALGVATICKIIKKNYLPLLRGGALPNRLHKNPKLSRYLFKSAFTNVAPSPYLLQHFKNEGYTNLTYIPNTIEIKNYPFLKRTITTPKMLWVRSFAKIYNPILALKILKEILKTFPEAQLTMVGPDKDGTLQVCKAYVQKNNLPVQFTGKLNKEDWIALSKSFNIFLNTTHFDNTPVSVIEAMALGLPVISTNVGGIPYLLNHKENALLVNDNHLIDFINAIKTLIAQPEITSKIITNAREKVEQYDWEVIKQEWIALLKK